ncbi:MAG: FAD:protein FMN transferase [Jatrophihabitans sp.]|uniref:FAD:protein FMN transferase n=1 Tax=Jatrophihabitans sp. TaxID=1932789 RepID=UPI0039166D36
MTPATQARTRHVEHCMGTVFSIDVRDTGNWDDAVAEVVTWLHEVDAVFSTYRPDSDISRMGRGELTLRGAHPEVATVLDLSAQIQLETDGAFSAVTDRRLDPTGLVKGWAVERASRLLRARGSRNHLVNGGGDVQLSGEAAPGRPWTVGITDPHDSTTVLTTVCGQDFAVATSGTAERGAHIRDPYTGRAVTGVASASVTGPSLTFADAFATAVFVKGDRGCRWIEGIPGYEALVVLADGTVTASSGWGA